MAESAQRMTTHPVGGIDEVGVLLYQTLGVSPHRVGAERVVLVVGVRIQDCTQNDGDRGKRKWR